MKQFLHTLFFIFISTTTFFIHSMESQEHLQQSPKITMADLGLGDEENPIIEPVQTPPIIPLIDHQCSPSQVINSCKQLPFMRADMQQLKPATIVDMQSFMFMLENYKQNFYRRTNIDVTTLSHSYVEKNIITPQTSLYIHGDIHGDAKSLALYLEQLMQQGVIDDTWCIKAPYQLIFLGDYIDRGLYNIETLFILTMLIAHNPYNVILIQGNHDIIDLDPRVNSPLKNDIILNIIDEKQQTDCLQLINYFFTSLPAAVFTQVKNTKDPQDAVKYTMLFCHGGCSYEHTNLELLLNNPPILYQLCPHSSTYCHNIYSLVDFNDGQEDFDRLEGHIGDHGQLLYKNGTIEWMRKYKVSAIFRGHQHANIIDQRWLHISPVRFMKRIIDGNGVAKLWRPENIPAAQPLWNNMVCTLNVSPDSSYGEGCRFDYDTYIKLTIAQTFETCAYEQIQIPVVPPMM